MPFILVDVDLQGCDSKALLTKFCKVFQLLHRGVLFADDHALTQGRTASDFSNPASLLVYSFAFLSLHRPTGLFLNHLAYIVIILLKGQPSLLVGNPRVVVRSQVFPDVELVSIDVCKIFFCSHVVSLTLPDIAGFDMYRSLCHN